MLLVLNACSSLDLCDCSQSEEPIDIAVAAGFDVEGQAVLIKDHVEWHRVGGIYLSDTIRHVIGGDLPAH